MRVRLPGDWLLNAYIHPSWKDVHGNRWWIEFWHPKKPRKLIGRIDGKFGLHE